MYLTRYRKFGLIIAFAGSVFLFVPKDFNNGTIKKRLLFPSSSSLQPYYASEEELASGAEDKLGFTNQAQYRDGQLENRPSPITQTDTRNTMPLKEQSFSKFQGVWKPSLRGRNYLEKSVTVAFSAQTQRRRKKILANSRSTLQDFSPSVSLHDSRFDKSQLYRASTACDDQNQIVFIFYWSSS